MLDGLVDLHRLMREQHARARGVPVAERLPEVGPLALALALEVVDPGEVESGEFGTGVLQGVDAQRARTSSSHCWAPEKYSWFPVTK